MKKFLASLLFFVSFFSFAACPELYPNGKKIELPGTVEICNSFFVSVYDPSNRAVIFVSEKLTAGTPVGQSVRVNSFHADYRLTKGPTPSEYLNTGYDKGHMAPAQDAINSSEMYETFSMTNMTPQEPTLNEQSWKLLEMKVRKNFARDASDYWILNIALYNKPKRIGKGIPVPSGYWKIVFSKAETTFFYADNLPYAKVLPTSSLDFNVLIQNASRF